MLNVVLAIKELGVHYRLPERTIEKLFVNESRFSYFGIISCLFYMGDDPDCKSVMRKVIRSIDIHLSDLSEITRDSEMACLFLDMMSCPYIHSGRKKLWIKRLYAALSQTMPPAQEVEDFISLATQNYWFVNWRQLDLLSSLERKELKRAY